MRFSESLSHLQGGQTQGTPQASTFLASSWGLSELEEMALFSLFFILVGPHSSRILAEKAKTQRASAAHPGLRWEDRSESDLLPCCVSTGTFL